MADVRDKSSDANRDPITGAPGSHPFGTGIGAALGGMAAGAAAGTVVGPVGTAIGAVAGAIAGGLAGKAAGEAIDPTRENAYWRDNYERQPYYQKDMTYAVFWSKVGWSSAILRKTTSARAAIPA